MTRCDMIRCEWYEDNIICFDRIDMNWLYSCVLFHSFLIFQKLVSKARGCWYSGDSMWPGVQKFCTIRALGAFNATKTHLKTCNFATVKWVKCQTPKPPESCRLCHKELVTTLSESPNLLSSSGALASSSLPNHHRHLKWIQVTRAVAGQNPATNPWRTEPSRWSWIEGSTHCPLDMAGHQGSGTTARPNNYSFWEASTVEKQICF